MSCGAGGGGRDAVGQALLELLVECCEQPARAVRHAGDSLLTDACLGQFLLHLSQALLQVMPVLAGLVQECLVFSRETGHLMTHTA